MCKQAGPGADPRAVKILFDTYWTSVGWRVEAISTPSDDFEYAKSVGVMFDHVCLTHDELVERALPAIRAVNRRAVADAFAVSLASRRLELRSALGSFAVLQYFPRHSTAVKHCPVCGEYDLPFLQQDLNVLNFERLKWGGVGHDRPLFAALDLELFARMEPSTVRPDDAQRLRAVLSAIEAAPPDTSSAALQKHLATVIKSNKAERDNLIGILGLCGILGTAEHPGYLRQFVPASARKIPARRFVDMAYPACWWTRADGISKEAVAYWFGHLL